MKVAIITDTHHGCHSNNQLHLDYQIDFLKKLNDYIKDNEIEYLIHLGDVFDKKTILDKKTAVIFTELYNNIRKSLVFSKIIFIAGNHDQYYANDNKFNALRILFPNDIIVDERVNVINNLVFSPWVNKNNLVEITSDINEYNKSGNYLFGHFNKKGAYKTSSYKSEKDTLDNNMYSNYSHIFSGHYHLKQTIDNWSFVGSSYNIDRGDILSKHGFITLDTKTGKQEFVVLSDLLYHTATLKENECESKGNIKNLISDVENKILDIHVDTNDQKIIDKVVDVICELKPYEYNLTTKQEEEVEINTKELSTFSDQKIIHEYLKLQDYQSKSEEKIVKALFNKIYKSV